MDNLTTADIRGYFITRSGETVLIVHVETELSLHKPVVGYILGPGNPQLANWNLDGTFYHDNEESHLDLISVKPIEFDYWHLLNPKIKFISKNKAGVWAGFSKKPTQIVSDWVGPPESLYYSLQCTVQEMYPACVWRDSLIERPKEP